MARKSPPPTAPSQRRQPERINSIATRLLHAGCRMYCRGYHHIELLNGPRLPASGAAMLICNHTSGLDPLLIQSVCSRVIVWMMAREYYEIRLLQPFFRQIEAIPVDRSGRDTSATRAALRALHSGRILGIFPEGRIAPPGELLEFQSGAALLAVRSKVAIYPAYLDGTQHGQEMLGAFGVPHEARLNFGPPIRPPSDSTPDQLQNISQTLRSAVDHLRTQWYT